MGILRRFGRPFSRRVKMSLLVMAAVVGFSLALPAFSDAAPTTQLAPVSADALPTAQIDGVVWAQVVVGNTVYATGRFDTARPAGVEKGGAGTVKRAGIVAFDIRTGVLNKKFVHHLGGASTGACYGTVATGPQGCAIAVSPDKKTLYVGGTFSTVDGKKHSNLVAFDLATNKIKKGFSGVNGKVSSLAVSKDRVYVGGQFSQAGGRANSKLAAFSHSNGAVVKTWKATVDGRVAALTVAKNKLIIGGTFSKLNGKTYYSTGAVTLTKGANVAWASQSKKFPIRNQQPGGGSGTGITSLSTDGTQVYLTSFTFFSGKRPGTFEGRAAVSATDGKLIWMNDCQGDSYSSFPIGKILYSAGHAHNCKNVGSFPEMFSRTSNYALAETTTKTGKNTTAASGTYPSYIGQPAGTVYNWFPSFSSTNYTGMGQNGWSVTGNSQYVVYGGEFGSVNGVAQQGLVRFTLRSKAPNKVAPLTYAQTIKRLSTKAQGSYGVFAMPADSKGNSVVRVYTTSDYDDTTLTYTVYRAGSTKALATKTVTATYWQNKSWTFTDTGITPGRTAAYDVAVKDGDGNITKMTGVTAINDTDSSIVYAGSGWKSLQNRSADLVDFAKGSHQTSVNGDTATYTFYGTGIIWLAEKNPDRGVASVSIDGGTATQVTLTHNPESGTKNLFQQKVYKVSGLAYGKHTIKITKLSGKYIDIDAFVVAGVK